MRTPGARRRTWISRPHRSIRTKDFRRRFNRLPQSIRNMASKDFERFQENPDHPALQTEELHDTRRGRHRPGSRSVRVGLRYRAIYFLEPDRQDATKVVAIWYWIGSHEDYNNFISSK